MGDKRVRGHGLHESTVEPPVRVFNPHGAIVQATQLQQAKLHCYRCVRTVPCARLTSQWSTPLACGTGPALRAQWGVARCSRAARAAREAQLRRPQELERNDGEKEVVSIKGSGGAGIGRLGKGSGPAGLDGRRCPPAFPDLRRTR